LLGFFVVWYTLGIGEIKCMNVIIYTQDFEPITVIDLPVGILEAAERDGSIGLAMRTPIRSDETLLLPKLITVDCIKIPWIDGSVKSILVTLSEEDALRLKPEWLVGQRAVVKAYERTLKILTEKLKKLNPED
jgi:hypothetical protein